MAQFPTGTNMQLSFPHLEKVQESAQLDATDELHPGKSTFTVVVFPPARCVGIELIFWGGGIELILKRKSIASIFIFNLL